MLGAGGERNEAAQIRELAQLPDSLALRAQALLRSVGPRHLSSGVVRALVCVLTQHARCKSREASSIKFEWIPTVFFRFYVFRSTRGWPERSRLTRHEDFQSSVRTETMGHYRSLLVSIQAFDAGFRSLILPIRTHSGL